MSLYIGNLSPRVRKEELESMFGRFGKCDIRLKDGYGFAIYGIRAQAEVAMRALRGSNVCGLPISLSWSNKQPNAPQSFSRGARSEVQRGRGFERRDDHMNGPFRSNARQHYKFRQPDADARRSRSKDLHTEKGSFDHVSEDNDKKEDGQDKSDKVDNNHLESDRWGEYGRLSNDTHDDDGTTFERYNPDRDYERTDKEGDQLMLHDASPRKGTSDDKFKKEEAVDVSLGYRDASRSQACFRCGDLGHKKRDCPLQDVSQERQDSAVGSRRRGRIEFIGAEPSSRRRLSSTLTKERMRDRKDSGSERRQRVKRRRSSPVSRENYDNGKRQGQKKRNEDENGTFKRRHGKRRRRSLSDSLASSSRSSSISRSSVSYSSSSLMSGSKSNRIKSRSAKSRFKSRSRSRTARSISDSLGQPLSSPPNITDVKLNGSIDNLMSLQTKQDVIQESQQLEVAAEDHRVGYGDAAINVQSKMNLMQENEQVEVVSKEENFTSGDPIDDEDMVACVDLQDDLIIDDLQKNDDEYLEEQHDVDVISSPQALRRENVPQTLASAQMIPDSKIKSTTRAKCTSISMDELDTVMRHYSLKHTDENGGHLSIEDYFGCARLWPWEIIYYRRLKKGPISTENYARRLAQNKEFGIIDKYVRSSSGWGEPAEELDTKDPASL